MQVVNGQNLPKPGGAKEIIDPYVVMELFGAHEDKKVFKSKVVNDNGEWVWCDFEWVWF
jgi:Ca2+-dependent lipid-binding protein